MSELPNFEHFLSVGNLKPKLEWVFKPKLKPKNFIELGPCAVAVGGVGVVRVGEADEDAVVGDADGGGGDGDRLVREGDVAVELERCLQ